MKLSKETLAILNNFAKINNNIFIESGSELRTMAANQTIVAEARIQETFPVQFGIADLSKFLASIAISDGAELDFSNTGHVLMETSGKSKLRYVFDAKDVLIIPRDERLKVDDPKVDVNITKENFDRITKAASILDVEFVSFVGDGENLSLVARPVDNDSGSEFSLLVGQTDQTFAIDFHLDKLKMIPGNYNVKISNERISKWTCVDADLVYFIASSITSRFV